jgi:alpha-D-xyloside xylohydrolase
VLRSLRGDDFATIFRAVGRGEQTFVHGVWAGDQPGDWIGLQRAIRSGSSAGLVGLTVWGSDVGGYSSRNLTPEVFARWAQLGAVSPVFEVGGAGPNGTPWELGDAAMRALRDAAVLHYELFPYFYDLVRRGQPVLLPLAYAYPHDASAWAADLELLVGPSLLAAPVAGPGTDPSVYLPKGSWIDLYTGKTVAGPRSYTRPTPLSQLPLYVRARTVMPFAFRTPAGSWWDVDELVHRGRAGWLATNGSRLDLRRQPRDVQLFVPAPRRPRTVALGGRRVRWEWSHGPLLGVVIRLHGPTIRGRIVLSGS